MRRELLFAAGLVLLAVAVLLHTPPAGGDATAALGRSMGGMRVMVIDALFLRAEAQRKRGRVEDAAALYRTVLDLDPANEAAAGFLAETYVQGLMPQIADPDERFGWWLEARTLLLEALARRPGAPGLHARLANLILHLPRADPELEGLLTETLKRPRLIALRYVAAAARATETLPRLGRDHLVKLALLTPDVAGRALARKDAAVLDEAADLADEMLRLRGPLLATIREDPESPHMALVLRTGMAAVKATAEALGGGPRKAAEDAVDTWALLVPRTELESILRDLLAPR